MRGADSDNMLSFYDNGMAGQYRVSCHGQQLGLDECRKFPEFFDPSIIPRSYRQPRGSRVEHELSITGDAVRKYEAIRVRLSEKAADIAAQIRRAAKALRHEALGDEEMRRRIADLKKQVNWL